MTSTESSLFCHAVNLIDTGQVIELDALLKEHPWLLAAHCHHGEWYESGYFAGATLLHHIAGNPIRTPLPGNIVEVTQLLLDHGADPNITTDEGGTTIGLLLTGKQVSDAGVGVKLIDLLAAAGGRVDFEDPSALSLPLCNCGRATAEELVARGVKMDLRHAAGLGRVEEMERLLMEQPTLLEEAVLYACRQNEIEAARWLIEHGAKGEVLVSGCFTTATALHVAANEGRLEIVKLLLENGARADVVEPTFGGTAIGWAEHGGHREIADLLRDSVS